MSGNFSSSHTRSKQKEAGAPAQEQSCRVPKQGLPKSYSSLMQLPAFNKGLAFG